MEADISSKARSKWWRRRIRFGGEAFASDEEEEASKGNGSDDTMLVEGSRFGSLKRAAAPEGMSEAAGGVEDASSGWIVEVGCSGSAEMAELMDTRGAGVFCNESINSVTDEKHSDKALDEDEVAANASDNEVECFRGESIESGCGEGR